MLGLGHRELALLPLLGHLVLLTVGLARADVSPMGRVFFVRLESGSKGGEGGGYEAATTACVAQGARVAAEGNLHHAVSECGFSACSRGWLSGPSVGSTVCSTISGIPRPVDVQMENVTNSFESQGVFCVKDSDAPCGQPPSFPHSHLQGKTGLDLGDEVLYACNLGYKLPNGETAYSLLCDSCGEWYGLAPHCVKDDPESHVDYEDKFTDGHLLEKLEEEHHISFIPGGTHSTNLHAEEPTPEPVHELTEEEEPDEDPSIAVTEPPVSELSQKHMFWFPSEAFQDEKDHPQKELTHKSHSNNQDIVKTNSHDAAVISEEHGLDYDLPTDAPANDSLSTSVSSTDESWIDGYPIAHDEDEADDKSMNKEEPDQPLETDNITGHSEMEDGNKNRMEEERGLMDNHRNEDADKPDEDLRNSDQAQEDPAKDPTRADEKKHIGGHDETQDDVTDETEKNKYVTEESQFAGPKKAGFDGPAELKPTTITQTTASPDDVLQHKRPMTLSPSSGPENVSTSQEGLDPESTATPPDVFLEPTHGFSDESTNLPTPIIKVWESLDHFLHPDHGTTDAPENHIEMEKGSDHSVDQQDQRACTEDPCHASSRGPMIAAILVGVAAAVVGVALGVWGYKKRQQKSSQYQLNGTNRQTQCIELQQTV